MMTPESLLEHLLVKPFRPFRIHMASGRSVEVRHPEMIHVGTTNAVVFTPRPEDRENDDPWQKISLLLIESIEPVDRGVKSSQATS